MPGDVKPLTMSWYAVGAVGDAVGVARRFLFPFDAGRWLRLAAIALFLGGVGGGGDAGSIVTNSLGAGDEPFVGPPGGPTLEPPAALPAGTVELAVAAAAVLVGLALLFGLVSSVMRLVLIDVLRTDEVRVRGPFRRRFGQGARLFGFALGLGLLVSLPLIAFGGLFALSGPTPSPVRVGVAVLLVVAAALLAVPYALVVGFTNTFVAPVMVAADCGVLAGWRRFWPALTREWAQFVVYLIARILLSLVVGVAVGAVVAVVGAAVAVAAIAVRFVAALPFGGVEAVLGATAGVVALALLAVGSAVALWLLSLPVRIPVLTYFTAYELLVLRRAAPKFDLLPWYENGPDGGSERRSAET